MMLKTLKKLENFLDFSQASGQTNLHPYRAVLEKINQIQFGTEPIPALQSCANELKCNTRTIPLWFQKCTNYLLIID